MNSFLLTYHKSVWESKEAGGRKVKVFAIYINPEIWRIFCKNNIDDQIVVHEKKNCQL